MLNIAIDAAVDRDWNVILSFSGMVTPSIVRNNLRIINGSKLKGFKSIEPQRKIKCSCEAKCVTVFFCINSKQQRLASFALLHKS